MTITHRVIDYRPTTTIADRAAALRRAGDAMASREYLRGAFQSGTKICTTTALLMGCEEDLSPGVSQVVGFGKVKELTRDVIQDFLQSVDSDETCDWNNKDGRTKEQIVDALHNAARSLEAAVAA